MHKTECAHRRDEGVSVMRQHHGDGLRRSSPTSTSWKERPGIVPLPITSAGRGRIPTASRGRTPAGLRGIFDVEVHARYIPEGSDRHLPKRLLKIIEAATRSLAAPGTQLTATVPAPEAHSTTY